jgi:hypothetical protein
MPVLKARQNVAELKKQALPAGVCALHMLDSVTPDRGPEKRTSESMT